MHSGKSGQNLWLAVTVKNTPVLNYVTTLIIRKMELVVSLSVFTLSLSLSLSTLCGVDTLIHFFLMVLFLLCV